MTLIIDTFNVLHVTGVLPTDVAGVDVQGLVELLQVSRFRDQRVRLICDGKATPDILTRVGKITVAFVGSGKEADDEIRRLVRISTTPRRLTIVTSDRAILKAARSRRCRTIKSEAFLAMLGSDASSPKPQRPHPKKPPAPLSSTQVQQWLKRFNIDPKLAAIKAADPPPPAASESSAPDPEHVPEPRSQPQPEQPADQHTDNSNPEKAQLHQTDEQNTASPVKSGDPVQNPAGEATVDGIPDDMQMSRLFPDVTPLNRDDSQQEDQQENR